MPLCEPRCASRRALGSPRESPRVPASIGPRRCLPRRVPRGDGVLRRHQRVASRPEVARRWLAALSADQIGICDHVRLEILYSANSATDYDALADELDGLARIPVGAETFTRACQVQRELAHVAGLHHRSVKIADLVIAAAAELSGTIVWHYDENYDRVAAITGQPTEWIVPRGTL